MYEWVLSHVSIRHVTCAKQLFDICMSHVSRKCNWVVTSALQEQAVHTVTTGNAKSASLVESVVDISLSWILVSHVCANGTLALHDMAVFTASVAKRRVYTTVRFEEIELPAKLLDYFLWSNSNRCHIYERVTSHDVSFHMWMSHVSCMRERDCFYLIIISYGAIKATSINVTYMNESRHVMSHFTCKWVTRLMHVRETLFLFNDHTDFWYGIAL